MNKIANSVDQNETARYERPVSSGYTLFVNIRYVFWSAWLKGDNNYPKITQFTSVRNEICCSDHEVKKGKRKVQGVPQSQTTALPRHQEEEETDKSKQA